MLRHLGRHAGAGVGDDELDVPARIRLAAVARVVGVEPHVERLDGEAASGGHRVARVDREVDQHLTDLARVGLRMRRSGVSSVSSCTCSPIVRAMSSRMSVTTSLSDTGSERTVSCRAKASS